MSDTIPSNVGIAPDTPLPLRPPMSSSHHDDAGPLDPDALPWATWMEGVQVKILRASVTANQYTMLVRFAPGVQLPRHRHLGPVHAWTMSGRWHYLEYDWVATAGSYVFEESLGTHTFATFADNTEDTLVLFVLQGGMVLLNEHDLPWWHEDAETALHLYRQALEQQGDVFPEDLILT